MRAITRIYVRDVCSFEVDDIDPAQADSRHIRSIEVKDAPSGTRKWFYVHYWDGKRAKVPSDFVVMVWESPEF